MGPRMLGKGGQVEVTSYEVNLLRGALDWSFFVFPLYFDFLNFCTIVLNSSFLSEKIGYKVAKLMYF